MTDTPPNTNEIAQELWRLAAHDTPLGDMLKRARDMANGSLLFVLKAFNDAFDLGLGEVRCIVEPWIGWPDRGEGQSSEELERQHGARVRAARREQPRHTHWVRNEDGKGLSSWRE